jgi:hypothetical protein
MKVFSMYFYGPKSKSGPPKYVYRGQSAAFMRFFMQKYLKSPMDTVPYNFGKNLISPFALSSSKRCHKLACKINQLQMAFDRLRACPGLEPGPNGGLIQRFLSAFSS